MAQKFTIQVRYRPNHSTKVHFAGGNGSNPGDVVVTTDSTITFVKMPGSHDFAFATFTPNPESHDLSWVVTDDQITVNDSDTTSGTYEYTVCLTPAGHTDPVCSDPQIINRVE